MAFPMINFCSNLFLSLKVAINRSDLIMQNKQVLKTWQQDNKVFDQEKKL